MSHAPFSEGTETKQADDVDTEDHLVGAIIMAGLDLHLDEPTH